MYTFIRSRELVSIREKKKKDRGGNLRCITPHASHIDNALYAETIREECRRNLDILRVLCGLHLWYARSHEAACVIRVFS